MNDPRYIPPSDREDLANWRTRDLVDHATFMDERDARQRGLIRRLADAIQEDLEWCEAVGRDPCSTCKLLAEARGVEATNE